MQTSDIENLINSKINCQIATVLSDDERHYEAIVVSDEFINKAKIQRHRMIYQALGDHMVSDIHALTMKLYTSEEYAKINE